AASGCTSTSPSPTLKVFSRALAAKCAASPSSPQQSSITGISTHLSRPRSSTPGLPSRAPARAAWSSSRSRRSKGRRNRDRGNPRRPDTRMHLTGTPRLGLGPQISVHVKPLDVGIEPAGAGGFLGVHAEAVSALLVVVELDGAIGLPPA